METNLSLASGETLELGEDYWFEYLDDDGESSVTGMPGSERVFYLCIKYEEGLTSIESFCFDYAYQNAGSEIFGYTGEMYYCSTCGSVTEGSWYDYEKISKLLAGEISVEEYNDAVKDDFASGGYSVNSSLLFTGEADDKTYNSYAYHGDCWHYQHPEGDRDSL